MEKLLENLNEKQIEAVTTTEGPLLVLAGAGSGKTTVLVSRIAYIIAKRHVMPYNILAITFTNKAANEMKERTEALLGEKSSGMWIGTFHSICARILRSTIDFLGYSGDFIIYDSADTKTLMKECMREMDLDEKNFPLRSILSIISSAKNDMMDPYLFGKTYESDYRMTIIAKLYASYQRKLKNNNALDFDDIILFTVKILSKNNDVRMKYQSMFRYILVDEYQDTNNSQYMLIRLLGGGSDNVCVVGDDDQSIYKFRGANVENILSFNKDYPDARIVRLEENYRSTQNILDSANAVISNNKGRMGKQLWTRNGEGEKIIFYTAANEYDEGRFVVNEIKKYYDKHGTFADCAVLYRTNAQSRALEEMFMRGGVPYRVLAGQRFYDRKEIKDFIAYLRLIHNTSDDLSLRRIINEPKRKIGRATIEKAQFAADRNNSSLFEVISHAELYPELKSAAAKLKNFADMIKDLVEMEKKLGIAEFAEAVLDRSGYMAALTQENTIESRTRADNLEEFLGVVREFDGNENYGGTLAEFLEGITLVSDVDSYDESEDSAVLMTIHSAKGLEFPVVFLVGFEEELFPGAHGIESDESLEEERRLCYVAITRAKKKLYITKAVSRTIYGRTYPTFVSRFYKEIPKKYIEQMSGVKADAAKVAAVTGMFANKRLFRPKLKKGEPIVSIASKFSEGDRVWHKKFGEGTVLTVQEFGDDAIVQVSFDDIGTKQLMAKFAKLEKIQNQ